MGTTYKASFSFSCVKQHECVSCGSKFSYVLSRSVEGEGPTQSAASAAAENAATKAVVNDVDYHPCPNCGTVQPDMIADGRNPRFWLAMIVGVIGTLIPMFLTLGDIMSISTAAWVAFIAAGIACLVNGSAVFMNPNKSSERNRSTSQGNIAAGRLSLDEECNLSARSPESVGRPGMGQFLGLGMSLLAVVLCFMPNLLANMKGWTPNENCYPAVFGPGDSTTFYFKQKLKSIKGFWRGQGASCNITNAEELGLEPGATCGVTTKSKSWGREIEGDDSSKTMWAKIKVNSAPELAGKTMDVVVELNVKYPYEIDRTSFGERNRTFTESASLVLSSSGAGALYKKSSTVGLIGSAILLAVAWGIFLAGNKLLRGSANQTRVAMGDDEEDDVPPADSSAYQGGAY